MNTAAEFNVFEFILMLLLGGGFGTPAGVPPTEEDPIAKNVAPAECFFYASWAGTGTPDATSGNQTEQLLAEQEVNDFLKSSRVRIFKMVCREMGGQANEQEFREKVARLMELVQGKPGALYISELKIPRRGPPTIKGAGLLRVGDDAKKVRILLERMQEHVSGGKISAVKIGARDFTRIQFGKAMPAITWGIDGKRLFVGLGDGALEGLLSRVDAQPPAWLTNMRAKLSVPRVSSTIYVDVNHLVKMAMDQAGSDEVALVVNLLGLDKVKSFASVAGMDDKGCVSRSLLTVEEKKTGLLTWLDMKPLTADDMKPIGHDAIAALAFQLDASDVLDGWLQFNDKVNPRDSMHMRRAISQIDQQLGISIRDDLLESLGQTWRLFDQQRPNALVHGWTIAVEVKDRQKLERFQKALLSQIKTILKEGGLNPTLTEGRRIDGHEIYTLDFQQMGIPLSPSWCVTDDALFITLSPETLKPLLSGVERSLAEQKEVAALVGENSSTLAFLYADTGEIAKAIPPFVSLLQLAFGAQVPRQDALPSSEVFARHLQPSIIALSRHEDGLELVCRMTLPGGNIGSSVPLVATGALSALSNISNAMKSAGRAKSINNLKQIVLALHNFYDAYNAFPAGYSADKDGKPLLSWRVYLLPYIEQGQLFRKFHLDEPWNSPHNKKLIEKMPEVFCAPQSKNKPGKTNYLGVVGADGVFVRPSPGKMIGTSFRNIPDGTSNTIMVVEAADELAVTWTKPGDFASNKEKPTRGLLGLRPGGFLAAFADGSVRLISKNTSAATLKALFTKSGGEAVAP